MDYKTQQDLIFQEMEDRKRLATKIEAEQQETEEIAKEASLLGFPVVGWALIRKALRKIAP